VNNKVFCSDNAGAARLGFDFHQANPVERVIASSIVALLCRHVEVTYAAQLL